MDQQPSNQFEANAALSVEAETYPVHLGSGNEIIRGLSEENEQNQRERAVLEKALEDIRTEIETARQHFSDNELRRTRKQIRAEFKRRKNEVDSLYLETIKDLYAIRYDIDKKIKEIQCAKHAKLQDLSIEKQKAVSNWSEAKKQHYSRLQELFELERRTEVKLVEVGYRSDRIWAKTHALHRIERRNARDLLSEKCGDTSEDTHPDRYEGAAAT